MTFGLSAIAEVPYWIIRTLNHPDIASITPLLPILGYYFLSDSTFKSEFNPHSKDRFDEKSSRKATAEDIVKMGQDHNNKEGLFKGFMMVLGYFKYKGKQTPLMMDEALSTLCVAPPGTGKTQGVVVPTILDCDNVSMIINDPKPELKQQTSAYRATIGPVFIMNWAGQDDPSRGIYYPSWNPLSPEHVPYNPEQRDLYIDSICKVLVPDAKGANADPHWANTGRAGLSGLVNFIVSKIERARADDYFYSRINNGTFNSDDAAVLGDYYLSMMNDPNAYAAYSLLQKGELKGAEITKFVIENYGDNMKNRNRNPLVQYSGMKVNKGQVDNLLMSGNATMKDFADCLEVKDKEGKYQKLDLEKTYKVALPEELFVVPNVKTLMNMKDKFQPTGYNADDLFMEYVKDNDYKISMDKSADVRVVE